MLRVGGERYNIADIQDRERLHNAIDEWVESNFEELLMNGELSEEVSRVHELISEEDSENLHGKWFNGNLTITHWYDPLTEYLEEMEIRYEVLLNGDVYMYYSGKHIVFTRECPGDDNEDVTYEVCNDGIIRRKVLERYGLYYVKDYYLPKVA